MQFLITPALKQAMIAALRASVAAVGPLDAALLALGKENIDITANSTLAELEAGEATFVGYARKLVTWSVATVGEDGALQTVGEHPEFRPTNSVTPNTIFYAFLVNEAEDAVLAVGKFDGLGRPMDSALNNIDLAIALQPAATVPVDIIG